MLHLASLHDADQIAEFVLAKGEIPIDLEDKVNFIAVKLNYHTSSQYGETALHIAYKKESYKVQELLISEDANQTIKNKVIVLYVSIMSVSWSNRQDSVPKTCRLKPLKVSCSISVNTIHEYFVHCEVTTICQTVVATMIIQYSSTVY